MTAPIRPIDVAVIGSGVAGALIASELAKAGGSVALLAGPGFLTPWVMAQTEPEARGAEAPAPELPAAATPPSASPSGRAPEAMLEAGADWPAYGGTYHADRYSPLDQITNMDPSLSGTAQPPRALNPPQTCSGCHR